jgi:hypothetical protein
MPRDFEDVARIFRDGFGALTCSGFGAPLTSAAAGAPRAGATPWRTVAVVATALALKAAAGQASASRHASVGKGQGNVRQEAPALCAFRLRIRRG